MKQRVRVPHEKKTSDCWELFKVKFPKEAKELGKEKFIKILYHSNEKIRNLIIESPFGFKMPERLGYLRIEKYKPKLNLHTLHTDNSKSKKFDKKIVHLNKHTDGYSFKIYWNKTFRELRNIQLYSFKGSRILKRTLAHTLLTKSKDYFERSS